MKTVSISLFFIGIILVLTSFHFDRYTNEQEYNDKYSQLSGGPNDSKAFYKLRDDYLTPKFRLINYGITFLQLGLIMSILSFIGFKNLKSPNKKIWIILTGVLAALLSNMAYVCDLFLEMYRDSYPQWADSLAIPLMGVPGLFFLSLLWVALNLLGVSGYFSVNELILPINFRKSNLYYIAISGLTCLCFIDILIFGSFWYVIPCFLWIYFYLSILSGKTKLNLNQ